MKKGENYISWVGAYTTVMFSMIFLTVLSLVLSALEAVRVSAVRMEAEIACAVACEAFLSQYQPQVQARYGLYLVDRDGLDTLFLKQFIEDNCGGEDVGKSSSSAGWFSPQLEAVAIDGEISLAYEDFRYLEKQISDYMTISQGAEYGQEILNRITGISLTDVQEDQRQIASDMDQLGREAQINKAKAEQEAKNADSEGNGLQDTSSQKEEIIEVEDPRENISNMLKYPILNLVMGGNVSSAVLDTSELSQITPAENDEGQIRGFMEYRDVADQMENSSGNLISSIKSVSQEFLVDCYILHAFKNVSVPDKVSGICFDSSGEERQNQERVCLTGVSALEYEVEYIICGKASDGGNLQNIVNRISLIRMVMNMAYLMQSPAKSAAAHGAAAALSTAVMMPFLEQLIYMLILAAWAYGEALIDCRSLLEGKKVPFMKNDATWTLSLNQLSHIGSSQLSGYAGENGEEKGLSYEDYLRLFLLGVSKEKKYIRLMNLIEANTHLEAGGENFSVADSVFGISFCADFTFSPIFFGGKAGKYEHHVRKSAAY
ncbi:hypothetical protein HNP82_002020 [Catenibacillus scindens]|uniref:Uncharacterized protein n=1 Tax=Catenibacillus scindens TaxID=673271 RepID=A0A7W8M5Z4_9FIRM|nr:DUF5702 domain-containing protein [Catenibacillus scindens]MBB5264881.1 hypothetical protein [Catenibacillus scindens]